MFRTKSICAFLQIKGAFSPQIVVVRTAFKRSDTPDPDPELLGRSQVDREKRQYPERESFPDEFSLEPPKGKIYDKKPFRMTLVAGKSYSWCTCGHSRKQPFCDGTHKAMAGTAYKKRSFVFSPKRFTVPETKEYWLCNCKQSEKSPFCDGTHKRDDVQEAIKF